MLFEEEKTYIKQPVRPSLPKGFTIDYEIGFLFNFVSGKSTRFDLEPVLVYKKPRLEYKRISLQAEVALAYLEPLDEEFYNAFLEFSDNKLLAWMTRTGNRFIRNQSGSWAHLSGKELANLRRHYRDLLERLWPNLIGRDHVFQLRAGRFNNASQQTVILSERRPKLKFSVQRQGKLIALRLHLTLNSENAPVNLLGGFLLEQDGVLFLPKDNEEVALLDLFKNGDLTFPLSIRREIIEKYVTGWLDKYEVSISENLNVDIINPVLSSRIMLSELNESNLMIRPEYEYDGLPLDHGPERFCVVEDASKIKIIRRDKAAEQGVMEFLRSLHPIFKNQRNNHYFYLMFDEVMKKGWFITMMRNVQQAGHSIHGLRELKKFRYTTEEPRFVISANSAEDCFNLKITISWGTQQVSLKDVRQAILNYQDTIMLDDGTLGHIPEEWISQYSLLLRTGKEQDGVLKVSKLHYTLLEDILDKIDDKTVREDIEVRKRKLLDFDKIEKTPLSSHVNASLRPYQLSGFHWLQALDELGWGGCLADDMGLGKTLQTISFLQFLKDKYPGSTQLVVCPTSLIFNWESEIGKFCPTLKFYTYYGLQREFNDTHFEEYDVILTTYGVVRNDLDQLKEFLWQYVILDESQSI